MRRVLATAMAFVGTVGLVNVVVVTSPASATATKHHETKAKRKATNSTLLTQSGSGTASTATFTAPTNWNLAWSYSCSTFAGGEGNFVVTVSQNPHSGTMASLEDQPLDELGTGSSGVEHYHYGGGGVYLAIDSECSWTVTASKA